MTDEVGRHVLAHNYDQTLALSLQEADGAGELDAHAAVHEPRWSAEGKLDRKVEGLPDAVEHRRAARRGPGPDPAGAGGADWPTASWSCSTTSSPVHGARRPLLRADAWSATSPSRWRKYEDAHAAPPAAPRDHRHRAVANEIVNMCGPDLPRAAARRRPAATPPRWSSPSRRRGRCSASTRPGTRSSALDLKIPAEAQMALYQRDRHASCAARPSGWRGGRRGKARRCTA